MAGQFLKTIVRFDWGTQRQYKRYCSPLVIMGK